MILKGPPSAPTQAKALIDKLLARGCSCGRLRGAGRRKLIVGETVIRIVISQAAFDAIAKLILGGSLH
jgi:hypothetical protein